MIWDEGVPALSNSACEKIGLNKETDDLDFTWKLWQDLLDVSNSMESNWRLARVEQYREAARSSALDLGSSPPPVSEDGPAWGDPRPSESGLSRPLTTKLCPELMSGRKPVFLRAKVTSLERVRNSLAKESPVCASCKLLPFPVVLLCPAFSGFGTLPLALALPILSIMMFA